MRFVLINSPLLSAIVWKSLIPELESAGHSVSVVLLDNNSKREQTFLACHLEQVNKVLLENQPGLKDTVVVSHSGAGPVLASVDSESLAAYVMLDSIFPEQGKSRFDLFDSVDTVEVFREAARKNGGFIPARFLKSFGKRITDPERRAEFESELSDVPMGLYEERMNVPGPWPELPGLYIQWTQAYNLDLERARQNRFQVSFKSGSHFEMLNEPKAVAKSILDFLEGKVF